MDVVGNNIANVNTFGFKASRATFSDIFYQNIGSASRPTGLSGGTNPTQIGYGASIATIDLLNTQSGMSSTDRALDVYINGDGMIAVRDANNNLLFTRLGILGFDAEGNLVDSNGNFVMGFPMDTSTGEAIVNPDGSVDVASLSRIQVPPAMLDQMVGISIAPDGTINGMMPGDISASMTQGGPLWLQNVTVPADTNLIGGIRLDITDRKSVVMPDGDTEGDLTANWVRSVTAADGIEGTVSFTFDRTTQRIIAEVIPDGGGQTMTFSGQYSRGAEVRLTADDDWIFPALPATADASEIPEREFNRGQLGFVVSTDFTIPAPVGNQRDPLGGLTFALAGAITATATDRGGNTMRATLLHPDGFDMNDVTGMQELQFRFGEEDSDVVVVTVNGEELAAIGQLPYSRHDNVLNLRSFDNNPAVSGWLRSLSFTDSALDGFGIDEIALELRATRQLTLPRIHNHPLNFLNNATGGGGTAVDALNERIQAHLNPLVGAATPPVLFSINAAGDLVVEFDGTHGDPAVQIPPLGTFAIAPGTDPNTFTITIPGATPAGPFTFISDPRPPATTTPIEIGMTSRNEILASFPGSTGLTALPVEYTTGSNINIPITDSTGAVRVLSMGVNGAGLRDAFNGVLSAGGAGASTGAITVAEPADFTEVRESGWLFGGNVANINQGSTEAVLIGAIALGRVPNMAAMEQFGNSYFVTSANSGEPTFFRPGLGQTGTLRAGFLEMSNVDISKEFTEMIVTQRGFQANTRIISVSDEMLQELVNLRR